MLPLYEKNTGNIVWIKLQMTGLDPDTDTILEASCQVTNSELTQASKIHHDVIHQTDETLRNMNSWCQDKHRSNGLKQAVISSQTSMRDAEINLLKFISEYAPEKSCPTAGNSIYTDLMFLKKHMPIVVEHLSDKIIDVTTIVELCRHMNLSAFRGGPRRRTNFRSTNDLEKAIGDLTYYKRAFCIISP